MSKLIFTEIAWEHYLYWQKQDKKTLKRINALLQELQRDAFGGIGKPEPLKHRAGYWSRRIDDEHRLVYRINEGAVEIVQCKGHY